MQCLRSMESSAATGAGSRSSLLAVGGRSHDMRQALLLAGCLFFNAEALCSSAWDEFLRQPDSIAVGPLLTRIRESGCDQGVTPSSQQVAALTRLLASGRRGTVAIRPAFFSTRCLDGGDLEDVYRALGRVLVDRPKVVLRELGSEELSDGQVRYLTTTLPLTLVDNLAGQIAELDRRIARIGAIRDESTAATSRRMLHALSDRRRELDAIRAQAGTR